MENLLALTLADETPAEKEGEGTSFHWKWHGRGLLELTPFEESGRALVLSAGVHGNETAPVEIVNLLIRALFHGISTRAGRVRLVPGTPRRRRHTNAIWRVILTGCLAVARRSLHPVRRRHACRCWKTPSGSSMR